MPSKWEKNAVQNELEGTTIVVTNLAKGTTYKDLLHAFEVFGEIEDIRFTSGAPFAAVEFETSFAAEQATQAAPFELCGRIVQVRLQSSPAPQPAEEEVPAPAPAQAPGMSNYFFEPQVPPSSTTQAPQYGQPSSSYDYSNSYASQPVSQSFTSFKKATPAATSSISSEGILKQKYLDIAFLIDATFSMDEYINLVLLQIDAIVQKISSEMPTRIIRLAYAAYRDYPETQYSKISERLNFTQDIGLFKSSLQQLAITGGGDTCEDAVSGFLEVQKLEWSSNTRILFWIADAPCHGKEFHDESVADDFLETQPTQRAAYTPRDMLSKLKALQIRNFFFLKINNSTDIMVNKFKELYDQQGFELKQENFNADPAGFLRQIVGSVMYSVKMQFV